MKPMLSNHLARSLARRIPGVTAAAGLAAAALCPAAPHPESPSKRTIEDFGFLLERSPFSLPTAEEKSPLADRYLLTGAAEWDGVQRIFLLDKNSQERHVVCSEPGGDKISLIEFLPNSNPLKMQARVNIAGEIATLEFSEAPAQPQEGGPQNQPAMTAPPGAPAAPHQVTSGAPQPPPRRIIRRRVISGAPSPPAPR